MLDEWKLNNKNYGEITKIEKYTNTTSPIVWHKTTRGDAGSIEYTYLTLQGDSVVGISFTDEDLGSSVIDNINF